MTAYSADLDPLLDALLAGLPEEDNPADRPSPGWVALAGSASAHPSASRRFAERSGIAGVVLCREPQQAQELSAAHGADAVLLSSTPLAGLLAGDDLCGSRLLFIDTPCPSGSDLKLKLASPPALVVAALPVGRLRRQWGRRRLQRRLGRAGYDCLAMGSSEAIFRHRSARAIGNGPPRTAMGAAVPSLRIHSFDFWDTLITRWHPNPRVVFEYVGEQAGIAGFRDLRVRAEREARQQNSNYTIDHIYDALVRQGSIPAGSREAIQQQELTAEQEFAQPVRANLDRLQAGDVLISDMYLSADQMRRIARPYADLDRQPFLVSSGGKSSSSLWRQLKQAGISARHLGDNYMGDYVRAARRDHQVSLVRECRYSPLELRLEREGLVALANLMRLQRLAVPLAQQRQGQPATSIDGLLTVQRRFNLPLLYLVALELLQRGRSPDGPTHLLFCARDCGYLHGIYRAMVKACEQGNGDSEGNQFETRPPLDHYYLTSRKAKRKASKGYVAYSRSLLSGDTGKPDVLVVDVQGSGRTSYEFFSKEFDLKVRQLFIYTNQASLALYNAEGLLPRHFVRRLLPQACDLLEVLNYSCDHSLLDMHQLGAGGFIPEFEPENRPERLLEICRNFEMFFHQVKRLMHQGPFQHLFRQHDLKNFHSDHLELLQEVNGLEDLRLLRELYLPHHRRH